MLKPGAIISGRFEIEATAGQGGMATVYRARDRLGDGTVALKVLHAEQVEPERFVREASVLSQLSHEAIVAYVAHGTWFEASPRRPVGR